MNWFSITAVVEEDGKKKRENSDHPQEDKASCSNLKLVVEQTVIGSRLELFAVLLPVVFLSFSSSSVQQPIKTGKISRTDFCNLNKDCSVCV